MEFYEKNVSGCAILGILNEDGQRIPGTDIIQGIALMHDRSNGLGGGFAGYGIYPEFKDYYALHLMVDNAVHLEEVEKYLEDQFVIERSEKIPYRTMPNMPPPPLLRRYFVKPRPITKDTPKKVYEPIDDDERVVRSVFKINSEFQGALVFSSGKNMGIFKGVGYPEDVGKMFRLDEYEAYCWTAHGRFPTNSQAWPGGAHPFGLLDISVIHNGEISSYGINKRYLENYGYKCTLFTDTEVIAYLWDLFIRKQRLSHETAAKILAAPFWNEIDAMPQDKKEYYTKLRMIYSSALLNGPFSIVVGFNNMMVGLNDRIKLRPLVAAKTRNTLFLGSEESAIREILGNRTLEKIWTPKGGELVIGRVKDAN
jgi:glutamate synthase domain-containing protein 1